MHHRLKTRKRGSNEKAFSQSGTTVDGKKVIKGGFHYYNTHGLPIDFILEAFEKQGMRLDWEDFYLEGLRSGMSQRSLLTKIEHACVDVYGPDVRKELDEFITRVKENDVKKL